VPQTARPPEPAKGNCTGVNWNEQC